MEVKHEDVIMASARISEHVRRTPCIWLPEVDRICGCASTRLHFKLESLQVGGSFKSRGALNAILCDVPLRVDRGEGANAELREDQREKRCDVIVAHSSGNHASAVSWACSIVDVESIVVIPEDAPRCKVASAMQHGARVVRCLSDMPSRESTVARWIRACEVQGKRVKRLEPYDDALVIAGQGTVGLEMLEQVPELDAIVVPVSGGGLISGIAIAAKSIKPGLRIFGAEPCGRRSGDGKEPEDGTELPFGRADAALSLRLGKRTVLEAPDTMADGLRARLGRINFDIMKELVDDILIVQEESILDAMRICFEHLKLVVEPSGAASLAATRTETFRNHPLLVHCKNVGVVLSGGNVDMDSFWTTYELRSNNAKDSVSALYHRRERS